MSYDNGLLCLRSAPSSQDADYTTRINRRGVTAQAFDNHHLGYKDSSETIGRSRGTVDLVSLEPISTGRLTLCGVYLVVSVSYTRPQGVAVLRLAMLSVGAEAGFPGLVRIRNFYFSNHG